MKDRGFLALMKDLTFRPPVYKLTSRLHLRTMLRYGYFLMKRAKGGTMTLRIGGLQGSFFMRTARELRLVEIPFENGPGNEEPVLLRLLAALSTGDSVYDIGANVGVHTVFMARKVGPSGFVLAVEPDAPSFRSLVDNIRLNQLSHVRVSHCALGSARSEGFLSRFSASLEPPRKSGVQGVQIVRGDDLAREEGLPLPNAVKIDVEGFEFQVIKGMKATLESQTCRTVCCEIHPPLLPPGVAAVDVVGLLRDSGFLRMETFSRPENLHVFGFKESTLRDGQ